MPYLDNFIRCCRVEFCGNQEELDIYLNDIKKNPHQEDYLTLKIEIKKILDDSYFDYVNFLTNGKYETIFAFYLPDSYDIEYNDSQKMQFKAKKIIIDQIWNKLYPDDKIDI